MHIGKVHMTIAAVVLVTAVLFPRAAYAYLDPGTGAMLLQVIVGGLAAAGMILSLYWRKIKSFLARSKRSETLAESKSEKDD